MEGIFLMLAVPVTAAPMSNTDLCASHEIPDGYHAEEHLFRRDCKQNLQRKTAEEM